MEGLAGCKVGEGSNPIVVDTEGVEMGESSEIQGTKFVEGEIKCLQGVKRVVQVEAGEIVILEIERLDSKEAIEAVNLLNAIVAQVEIGKSSSIKC